MKVEIQFVHPDLKVVTWTTPGGGAEVTAIAPSKEEAEALIIKRYPRALSIKEIALPIKIGIPR